MHYHYVYPTSMSHNDIKRLVGEARAKEFFNKTEPYKREPYEEIEKRVLERVGYMYYDGNRYPITYSQQDIDHTVGMYHELNKEGTKMNRKQVLAAELARLQAELAKLSRFPDDTFEEGTVLRFVMKFPGNSSTYSYAAIKANDIWWITGSTNRTTVTKSWDDLIEWWGERVQSVEIMERKFDLLNGPQANEILTVNTEALTPMDTDDYADHRGVDY